MNKIIFASLLLCSWHLHAQDFCKKIKRDSIGKTSFTYTSPIDTGLIPPIKIVRSLNSDPEEGSDNFIATFQVSSPLGAFLDKNQGSSGDKEDPRIIVEFDDKSKFEDSTQTVNYEMINEEQLALRTVYITIDEKNNKDFTTKKMVKFSIGGVEKLIRPEMGNAYMNYFACISNVKK